METQRANSAAHLDTRCRAGLPKEPQILPLASKVLLAPEDPSGPLWGCWGASQGGGCSWDGSRALPQGP